MNCKQLISWLKTHEAATKWLVALTVLQIMDVSTTLMGRAGVEIEGNPLMAWVWRNGSIWAVIGIKMVVVLFSAIWVAYFEAIGDRRVMRLVNIGMGSGAAITALVVIWNLHCFLGG